MTDTTFIGYKNPYRYRGYRYDSETSLYYLQSRYYNPEMGRFINADDTSILQLTQGQLLGANLFSYCNNNAVMNSDPNGYYPWFVHWGIILGELLGVGALLKSGVYIKGITIYWKWLIPFLIANTKIAVVAGVWILAASFIITALVIIAIIPALHYSCLNIKHHFILATNLKHWTWRAD